MNWLQRLGNYAYSLYFNVRYLPWHQARHIPILVSPSIRIGELHRGDIILTEPVSRAMVSWGFKGVEGRAMRKTYLSIHRGGRLVIKGGVVFLNGTGMVIHGAIMTIGNHFLCNSDSFFHVTQDVTFGDDCLLGWNVQVNTTDGHRVWLDGREKQMEYPIVVGNHVWIGADSLIFKNSVIPDGCIVAQRSLVSKHFVSQESLIAGTPAKIIKEHVKWEH
ncbi:MAG: acyltransferase [Prevotella sp.]|nr:acyltransferase [Prevotella sp.]